MSDKRWRPLSVREDPERAARFDGPHPGVPEWLRVSLLEWVFGVISSVPLYGGVPEVRSGPLRAIERNLQVSPIDGAPELEERLVGDSEFFLDVLDFLCARAAKPEQRVALDAVLTEGGSVWHVVGSLNRPRLERRVDEATEQVARDLMAREGRPHERLAHAWNAVYGRNPDPSKGYAEAVKAVEAAACRLVLPNDDSATLGRVLGEMKSDPSRWTCIMQSLDGNEKQVERAIAMARLLWGSHRDRHDTGDETTPANVSLEEAEAAVHLAIPLVQWFTQGVIKPSTSK